jgi:glycosyltransferase involved in cell wall biosynthesis
MRIVIDLQACQSSGSRTRGIGRYSLALAQAMARQAGDHEIWLLLSGLFPDTIQPLREAFDGLVPSERIRVWHSAAPVAACHATNAWRLRAAELVREQALAELRPDFVHVSSLFEGFTDDAVTNVGALPEHLPTAVTLYDLIPLVYAGHYLNVPQTRHWYDRKVLALKNADLLLAISAASRQECLELLHIDAARIVNISSAVDARFQVHAYAPEVLHTTRAQYGLVRPFVMYTGGIDHRKNIEGLIQAYADLPMAIRQQHQLAVVCSANPADRTRLMQLAKVAGLAADELILTGFVPDEVLPVLYNDCALFVFPSWHEGFGLPALEAMACGAAVIAANTSSLPEVIGRVDATFDPRDNAAITAKMLQALSDPAFNASLREHGRIQAGTFSWDASARVALDAMAAAHHRRLTTRSLPGMQQRPLRKPKLAFVSPLPPQRSGIADYSAELALELAPFYDIELIVNQDTVEAGALTANFPVRDHRWFDAHAKRYDRVLYHFGNSEFHTHMFALLARHPGVVVLHDFFLSGLLAWREGRDLPGGWSRALYHSHGYHALLHKKDAHARNAARETIMAYPCNLDILNQADGVIVHAAHSRKMAVQWYGEDAGALWKEVPLLRKMPSAVQRSTLRADLGLADDDFLVCTFGILAPTKLNQELLDAWLASPLGQNPKAHLVFVGQNDGGDYGKALLATIARSGAGQRIRITGFAAPELFRTYLGAADVTVQLRTMSRGETSAAVLDCMAYGNATIINAHAAMAELPDHALVKMPDEFSQDELSGHLMRLYSDQELREELGQAAAAFVAHHHGAAKVATQYAQAIETIVDEAPAKRRRTIAAIAGIEDAVPAVPGEQDLVGVATGLSATYAMAQLKKILVDISAAPAAMLPLLRELLAAPPAGYRIEPVRLDAEAMPALFRYAHIQTCEYLGIEAIADDDVVAPVPGDIFIGSQIPPDWRNLGVQTFRHLGDMQ